MTGKGSLNRTIVGLKQEEELDRDAEEASLNRTIVGLKLCFFLSCFFLPYSLNRTIVGLKLLNGFIALQGDAEFESNHCGIETLTAFSSGI